MILFAGLCAVALAWWAFRRQPPSRVPLPQETLKASLSDGQPFAQPFASGASAAALSTDARTAPPAPPALAAFEWLQVQDLDASRREALLEAIKGIPRPPQSLQKLLSPEFVARASSGELSELVMGEPLIAAKVLSTVNAPFYGLQKPVSGIGQAVTFLGMNTVRNICVQYMLADAFKPRLATSQKAFDGIWRASALASELCVRLSKALNMPDQGGLCTQVVLGFVGHLSAASLMPPDALDDWLSLGRLDRARREQETMGLSAGEVGGLLMNAWGLPEALVDGVRAVDRMLITPASPSDTMKTARDAVSYLCARLGERLAQGQLASLKSYDPFQDVCADTHHLNEHLRTPLLHSLPAALASAEVQHAMHQLLTGEVSQKA
jgi:HD-like signal output (HDOD) protein